ncbi:MAG: hypothetical protein ABSB22_25120 [Thermodesulfobacteriota bacterium]
MEAINKYLKDLIHQDPLFSEIREEHHFEGNRMSYKTVDGEPDETEYQAASSEFMVKREDVIAKGAMAYIENIKGLAEEMNRQKAKYFFDKMKEVTEKTGNIVDGKGQPMNFDLFLESIKKVWIEFDDGGNPILPTMVVSPELEAKLSKLLPEWEKNPEYKKAYEEVIELKRKEWNDRESHRKLVD